MLTLSIHVIMKSWCIFEKMPILIVRDLRNMRQENEKNAARFEKNAN